MCSSDLERRGFSAIIEDPGRSIALKSVEPNRRQEVAPGEFQQPRANAAPHPSGKQVELIDPAAVGTRRHSQKPDHQIIDDSDRGVPRGNQMPADPHRTE